MLTLLVSYPPNISYTNSFTILLLFTYENLMLKLLVSYPPNISYTNSFTKRLHKYTILYM